MNKAISRLLVGFRRFKEKHFQAGDSENSIYHQLASNGQTPKTLMIGCSDSRVDPAILTSASPGDLFVIRNVANLVPPCEPSAVGFHGTSSAIEFAVVNLKVENVIILGHRQCGGIRALMDGPSESGFMAQWMSIAEDARKKVIAEHSHSDLDSQCRFAELESIKVSLKNLHSFPCVKEAIETRKLNVVGIYFDLERGQLWEYDDTSKQFRQLEI
jgi:carbonic anhydrase